MGHDDDLTPTLRYYARLFDELHQGTTYTADAFVRWLIETRRLERDQLKPRARREPSGRPGRKLAVIAG